MKIYTPEISWHNRLPVLALDVAPKVDNGNYRVATGGSDCRVYIWTMNQENFNIQIRAGLRRHQKSVGAVRFSPQLMLASGDDDGYIYLWKQKVDEAQQQVHQAHFQQPQQAQQQTADAFLNDDGFEDLENWQHHKVLRGHIEDVCDLAWSKDGTFLLSGSVDNSAILWDANKGIKIWCSDLIKGYVQGVTIDPHTKYMAALSTDRTLRVYNFSDKKLLNAIRRVTIKSNRICFADDTVQTFRRGLEFSPDGQYLIAPTGRLAELEKPQPKIIEIGDSSPQQTPEEKPAPSSTKPSTQAPSKRPTNVLYVHKPKSFNKPVLYYPIGREVALCVRFSPVVYKLRDTQQNFWDIPYRLVFAVATTRSVLFYDSQQPTPFAYASQIHLARLTDLSWTTNGRTLMVASYDGYISGISFAKGEIGEIYNGPLLKPEEEVEPQQPAPPQPPAPKAEPKLATPKKVPGPIERFCVKMM